MKKIIILVVALLSFFLINAHEQQENNNNNDINRIIIHENRFDRLIDLAKSYMNTNSEFAFNCAYKANDIASKTNDKKKSADSKIIIGDIFNENRSYSIAISYYEKAIDDLLKINDHETICKIYIKIANLYQNNEFDSKWSIDAMEKALNYAKSTNNRNVIIETHIAYADVHLSQKKHNEALIHYKEILRHDINENTKKPITKTLTNIADIFIKEQKFQEALTLIDSSLKISNDTYNDVTIRNYGLKGCVFDSLKIIDSAKKYYQKAIDLSYSSERFDDCANYMYSLGLLNLNQNYINEAIAVFKILSDSTDKYKMYGYCHNAYYQLSKCHAICGEYEEAYNMLNKHDLHKTKADNYYKEKKIKDIHTSYLLSLNMEEIKARELEVNNIRNTQRNTIIIMSGVIIIIISLIATLTLFAKNKNLYHKSKEIAYEQQLRIDHMENELMEIQLRNNKESLVNLALNFKSYIEYLNPLKAKLKEVIDSPESEQKNKIKNIYLDIQNNNSLLNNTENLHNQINEIYKDFIDRLEQKYPTITKSEKRLCAMLYINLSSKEIATISNTTIRSVETSRYRLRKKFNLSRDEDMVNFLKSI